MISTSDGRSDPDENLLQVVAAFKSLLVYFGKRDSEAEADKLNSDNFFTLLVDFASDGLFPCTLSHITPHTLTHTWEISP